MSMHEKSSATNGVRRTLSPREWSAVTSPGFSTRIARAIEQDPPLREISTPGGGRSYALSPLQMSPTRTSGIGLPSSAYSTWKHAPGTSALRFSSPQSANRSLNMGFLRREENVGRLFLKIAPLTERSSPKGSTPDGTDNGVGISHSGSVGLGGTRSPSITNKMNRMWPRANNGVYEAPSTPPVPNLTESLNRKRSRNCEQNLESSANGTSPTVSAAEEVKTGKRSRFLNTPSEAMSNSSLASVPLTNYHNNADMSSESILEQMNQTEKRFLPDDDGTPVRPNVKRQKSNTGNSPSSSRSLQNQNSTSNLFRKRKVSPRTFAVMEEEEVQSKEKAPRLCGCADCYREAAGTPLSNVNLASSSVPLTSTPTSSKVQAITKPTTNGILTQSIEKQTADVTDRQKNGVAEVAGKDFLTKTRDALSPFAVIDKEKYYKDEKLKRGRLYKILELSNDTPRTVPNSAASRSMFSPQSAPNPSMVSSSNSAVVSTAGSPILSSGASGFTIPTQSAAIPNSSFIPNQSVAPVETSSAKPTNASSPLLSLPFGATQTLNQNNSTTAPTFPLLGSGNPPQTSVDLQFGAKPTSQQTSVFGNMENPQQSVPIPTAKVTTPTLIPSLVSLTSSPSPSVLPALNSSAPITSVPVSSSVPSKPVGTSAPFGGFGIPSAGTPPALFGLGATGVPSPSATQGFTSNSKAPAGVTGNPQTQTPLTPFQFGATPHTSVFGNIGNPLQPFTTAQVTTSASIPTFSPSVASLTSGQSVLPVVTSSAPTASVPVSSSVLSKQSGTSSPFGGFGIPSAGTPGGFGTTSAGTPGGFGNTSAGAPPSLFGLASTGVPSPSPTQGFTFNSPTPAGVTGNPQTQTPLTPFQFGATPHTSVFGNIGNPLQPFTTAQVTTSASIPSFSPSVGSLTSGQSVLPVVTSSAPTASVPVSSSVLSKQFGTSSPFGGFGIPSAGTPGGFGTSSAGSHGGFGNTGAGTPGGFGITSAGTPGGFGNTGAGTPGGFGNTSAGAPPSLFGLGSTGVPFPSPTQGFTFNSPSPAGVTGNPPTPSTPFQFGATPQNLGFGGMGTPPQQQQSPQMFTISNASPSSATRRTQVRGRRYR